MFNSLVTSLLTPVPVPGYVSLKNQHGAYLVTTPSGRIACWHRGHGVADDFEKFKFIYNKETWRVNTGDCWI